MICPQCGTNNADNALVCVQCGKNLQAPVVVPGQPGVLAPAAPVAVENYLVFAILTTVLCCLPAGIPAIVYAAQVNSKLQAGDIAGAQLASKNAKMWCWISFGGFFVAIGFWFLLVMIGVVSNIHR